jgi:hypothetical protein
VKYTKTSSRSVLGTITDFLKFIDCSGEDLNDLNQDIIDELNSSLNDMPVNPLGKEGFTPFPNRALKEYFRE